MFSLLHRHVNRNNPLTVLAYTMRMRKELNNQFQRTLYELKLELMGQKIIMVYDTSGDKEAYIACIADK